MGHTGKGSCICRKKWVEGTFTVPGGVNPKCTMTGHSAPLNSVAFSVDGRWIVSASDDSLVKIWNSETGAEVSILPLVFS